MFYYCDFCKIFNNSLKKKHLRATASKNNAFKKITLFSKPRSTDESILSKSDSNVLKVFAYGEHSFNNVKITFIIIAAIECSIQTKRFNAPLYQNWYLPICL